MVQPNCGTPVNSPVTDLAIKRKRGLPAQKNSACGGRKPGSGAEASCYFYGQIAPSHDSLGQRRRLRLTGRDLWKKLLCDLNFHDASFIWRLIAEISPTHRRRSGCSRFKMDSGGQ